MASIRVLEVASLSSRAAGTSQRVHLDSLASRWPLDEQSSSNKLRQRCRRRRLLWLRRINSKFGEMRPPPARLSSSSTSSSTPRREPAQGPARGVSRCFVPLARSAHLRLNFEHPFKFKCIALASGPLDREVKGRLLAFLPSSLESPLLDPRRLLYRETLVSVVSSQVDAASSPCGEPRSLFQRQILLV